MRERRVQSFLILNFGFWIGGTSSCPDKTGRVELMQFGVRFREFQPQGAFLGLNEQLGRLAWLRVSWR